MIVTIHGLRGYLDHTYRQLLNVLHEMYVIIDRLGLTVADLPDFTTVCTRKQDLEMRVWRVLLRLSVELYDLGDIPVIYTTGMDRIAANQYYAKRTKYTFEAVKTMLLSDCETDTILDIH